MSTFFMLAWEGERHEDCIPYGLYTLDGLCNVIQKLRNEDENASYYVFIMKPDRKWRCGRDCDFTISWSGEETRQDNVFVDMPTTDKEVRVSELADYLESEEAFQELLNGTPKDQVYVNESLVHLGNLAAHVDSETSKKF